MPVLVTAELLIVFAGVLVYIWRLQFTFPNFAILLLIFIVASFLAHRDSFSKLGFGSRGIVSGLKMLAMPTALIAAALLLIGVEEGMLAGWSFSWEKLTSLGRYFAWCLFQQFGLESFFTNRLAEVFKKPKRAEWASAAIFAAFHIPNPVLMPITLLGGVCLASVFLKTRNLVPVAIAQAVVGSLLGMTLPPVWHHGLRVGPGYYNYKSS
jgi:membrane protease YdiL (CAAX protease family)